MDNFKRPETVITLVNTAALLGASLYFYKKINGLEVELNKHSEHLTTTVKKVREMTIYKKHIATLGNAIKQLNFQLQAQSQDVESLKDLVRYQSRQIEELQNTLRGLEIENSGCTKSEPQNSPHSHAFAGRDGYFFDIFCGFIGNE